MKELNKETYFTLNGDEFNELVSNKIAPLTKNPERFKNFECVAEFEWNNYALYSSSVLKNDFMSNFYKEYNRKSIINAEKDEIFGLHDLLTFMLEHDIIKEGKYLIDPSW